MRRRATASSFHADRPTDRRMPVSPRDLVGHGRNPPPGPWPNGARIAISLVLNYEEGSEQAIVDGDSINENLGEAPRTQEPGVRDLAIESMYEYGSRVGVWRLVDIFDRNRVPATFFACALAVERNPQIADYLRDSPQHEVCSHGYRWEEVWRLSEAEEREHIRLAVESLERTTGRRPLGWYCRYGPSDRTRRLVVDEGGFEYDSDSYADDLPYYVSDDSTGGRPWLVVPYSLDNNDIKFWRGPAMGTAGDFFEYLRDAFDTLYAEGATCPKMMSVGLHCRIVGRPGRAAGLDRFIKYAQSHAGVWFARRIDIARAWRAAYGEHA
jgi:peptidoglycan/xylan/chitin deacetylase (PgdA/CDA1 family)